MKKIVFVGGGTLGHIYPMIPVVKKLKDKYHLIFIGTKSGLEKELIETLDIFSEKYYLDMVGLVRKISIKNFNTLYKYIKVKTKAKKLLRDINPHMVVGMGGYISGVVIKAAINLKLKTIIHEQNAVFGLANKMVYKKVNKVLLGLPLINQIDNENVVLVGNPRVSEIYEKHHGNTEEDKLIVVVGGSRGSLKLNDIIIESKDELLKKKFKIIMITGKRYYEDYKQYKEENFQVIDFSNDVISLFKKARIIISRSGASTLSEIMGLRKISILIPSPNVTNNHQEANADVLVRKNAAIKILEKNLNKDSLLNQIERLHNDKDLRFQMVLNLINLGDYNAREKFIIEMEKVL